jgi:tetratricopeptide (TPR) repeat protein
MVEDVEVELAAAVAHQRAGRFVEAEAGYRLVLATQPNHHAATHNLAGVLQTLGQVQTAEDHFRQALEWAPGSAASRYGLAQNLLIQGRYRDSQAYLSSRYDIPNTRNKRIGYTGAPPWNGESLAGKKLLIFPEQGLGDQIMMARFAALLQARGAEVTLLCTPALCGIFEGLGVHVVAASGAASFPRPDYWTTITDLPGLIGLDRGEISGHAYLKADRAEAAGDGFRVGICVSGNPIHSNDRFRSLGEADAQTLQRLPATTVSLAPQDGRDLTQMAKLIAGLDLVISVDSAIAHLAGALGRPVWILVSRINTDWRWGERGASTTPWYDSARLFWSDPDGGWSQTLAEIATEVASHRAQTTDA